MKKMKEAFSLVEIIITIAIASIVILALLAVLGYGMRSMSNTQAKVDLQNEARDAMNHITSYVMESATNVYAVPSSKALVVYKTKIGYDDQEDTSQSHQYTYRQDGNSLYFGKDEAIATLPLDKEHLLAEHVVDFECELINPTTGSDEHYILNVTLKMKNEKATYDCKKTIYLRTSR